MKTYRQILREAQDITSDEAINRFKNTAEVPKNASFLAVPDPESRDGWYMLMAYKGMLVVYAFYPAPPDGHFDDFEEFEFENLDAVYNLYINDNLLTSFLKKNNVDRVGTSDEI